MGLLRILLALCVVVTHAPSSLKGYFLSGAVSVQAFFIISGFYMALVLDRKYNFEGATIIFYQQRYLRLAPMYWVTLVVTLIAAGMHGLAVHRLSGAIQAWFSEAPKMAPLTLATLLATQLTLCGIDALMFLKLAGNPLHLSFTPSFQTEALPAAQFLVVPQAWSLSIEILFYILAPFVLRRSSKEPLINGGGYSGWSKWRDFYLSGSVTGSFRPRGRGR